MGRQVSLYVSDDTERNLDALMKYSGLPRSGVIRRLVAIETRRLLDERAARQDQATS